jgi:hypothetical protein
MIRWSFRINPVIYFIADINFIHVDNFFSLPPNTMARLSANDLVSLSKVPSSLELIHPNEQIATSVGALGSVGDGALLGGGELVAMMSY